jgi:cytochrome P450
MRGYTAHISTIEIDFLEDVIGERFKQMGCYTYKFNTLSATMITTADPENIQAILATKFTDFDLGPKRNEIFFEVLGNGIFTAEREAWVHYRHQLKPQFTRDQVSDLDSADRHLNVLFKALPEVGEDGWVAATELLPFLYRFTLDVSTEFLFGESVNSQSTALDSQNSGDMNDAEADMDFAAAMKHTQEMISWRLRLANFAWLLSTKKFKRACKIIKVRLVLSCLVLISATNFT